METALLATLCFSAKLTAIVMTVGGSEASFRWDAKLSVTTVPPKNLQNSFLE